MSIFKTPGLLARYRQGFFILKNVQMSKIIRSRRDTPFVQIDKTGPEDKNLSWKAKGILAYILCKPDDWQIYISELSTNSKDGKDSTRSGINELIKHGYIIRNRVHDENGKFAGYDYQVYERPITIVGKSENGKSTVIGKTVNGLSDYGKTVYGKSNTTNNNINNKDLSNNNNSESAREKITTEDIEDFELLEKIEQLEAEEKSSKKVAPKKVSFEEQELPNWMQVATEMAEYLNGEGSAQWKFMCDATGGYVEPSTISVAWAGRNADSAHLLRNWKKEIPKLGNWIKNELKSQAIHGAKIKKLENGKQTGSKKHLVTPDQLDQVYRELLAEGYE